MVASHAVLLDLPETTAWEASIHSYAFSSILGWDSALGSQGSRTGCTDSFPCHAIKSKIENHLMNDVKK